MTDTYQQLLEDKACPAPSTGFHVELDELHPWLKPHVRAIAQWGIAGGSRAFFLAYGLHKTSLQLAVTSTIVERKGGAGLIVAPLGVRDEFFGDAATMGIDLPFIRSNAEIRDGQVNLANYESVRDGKIDPRLFTATSLDEAEVLRSFGSKTYQEFLPAFAEVPHKFVATAMPSPNRYKELIHYAAHLGVMDSGQALTRFFGRNSEKANDLTLYPHKEEEFWLWVASWAIFLQKPSDLGFSDEGYILPPMEVRWHEVPADLRDNTPESNGQLRLIRDAAVGVQGAAREKRDTLTTRIAKMKELREAEPENHFILWHDLEDERRAIEQAIPAAVSVYGSQDIEDREKVVKAFKAGTITDLAAKPVMLGAGGNLQRHCHRAIFAGIGFKFRDVAQAWHRLQRFGQEHPVVIDMIYAETEQEVRRSFEEKWERDRVMRERMSEIIRTYGLGKISTAVAMRRSIGVEREEASGEGWSAIRNDCVDEARRMDDDSVGLMVTSIPFGTQYEYCESYNDFGHNDDNAGFFRQMDHLTPELLRILQPGRILAVHVKDRIIFGAVSGLGFPTVEPFHADCIAHYTKHGFALIAVRPIETDVVRENNQTYRLGYSEMRKDATKMGAGSPEYVLFFRKPQTDQSRGYADIPITKAVEEYSLARWQIDASAFWRSSGDRMLTTRELAAMPPQVLARTFKAHSERTVYDHDAHVEIAEALADRKALPKTFSAVALGSPSGQVWTDIVRMRTLNSEQSLGGREKHVCPLQIDVVDRIIRFYSNKGDLVFDPFAGLFTVPVRALMLGRRGGGSELHDDYWRDGVRYLRIAELEANAPTLFDFLETGEAA
jgi:hypothetical protein